MSLPVVEPFDFTVGAMQDHRLLLRLLAPQSSSFARVEFLGVENPVALLVRVLNSPHLIRFPLLVLQA